MKLIAPVLLGLGLLIAGNSEAQEWIGQARVAVERHDLPTAVSVVNRRLAEAPNDWEALGWHARITAWQGDWQTAEREYRQVLQHTPNDTDIIRGLADVLIWQQKNGEALEVLNRSVTGHAPSADVLKRRARAFTALGRTDDAKTTYAELLKVEPSSAEARAALSGGSQVRRFELRFGSDTDTFNYTDAANAQAISLRTRWNSRWATTVGGNFYQRFGANAQKLQLGTTLNISKNDYLSVGGAFANKQDVISRYDQSLEYGHVFNFRGGLIRGLEASVEERALWFTSSDVILVRGNALFYLPKDWMWGLSVTGARTSFDSAGTSWAPSGSTRLFFPLHQRLRGNLLFAVGSENFSNIDQIGSFSAQTYGGGLRFQITEHQDISAYGAYQRRSQDRSQTSMGVSYGIRF